MNAIKYILVGVLLAITISLISFRAVAFSEFWYINEFEKLNITAEPQQLKNLLAYLQGSQDLNSKFYTEREVLHLMDVKELNQIQYRLAIGAATLSFFVLALILIAQKIKEFFLTLVFANLAALILFIFLFAAIFLRFDQIFLFFHQISFDNDYWVLDPRVDNLINIFPPQLFTDMLVQTLSLAILSHIFLFLLAGLIASVIVIRKR